MLLRCVFPCRNKAEFLLCQHPTRLTASYKRPTKAGSRECPEVARLTRTGLASSWRHHSTVTPTQRYCTYLFALRISQRWLWRLLGSKAMQSVECHPTFSRNITVCYLVRTGILFDLLFYPDDGGSMFLRNICCLSPDYTALYPRRQNFIYFFPSFLPTALVDLGRYFSFLIYTQPVGLLGRGISSSHGRYLHTVQHKDRINAHRHPCLKWDANPRPQCSSGLRRFMP
jgi:hypothetical protein